MYETDTYYIKEDGWAVCKRCKCQFKGAGEQATKRVIEAHILRRHSDGSGLTISMDNLLRSRRTDYGAWV